MESLKVAKRKIYSRFDLPRVSPAPAGEKTEPEYGWIVDEKTGERRIGLTGRRKDIYELKQAALPSTYLNCVVERFNAGAMSLEEYRNFIGDPSVSAYIDVTEFPKTLAEQQQLIIDAEESFYALPIRLREMFDNSKEKFYTAVMDGSAAEKFSAFADILRPKSQESVKKEDIKNES